MNKKNYGYFDDARREFVITDPATPFPWINYLGNEDFFGLISNTAGGYNFYKDAKFRRITRYRYNGVPMDAGGRYFYVKEADQAAWSPGWKPCKTPLDSYECRHGMGYTRITGSKNGLETSALFFVPIGTWGEVQKLTLRNTSQQTKRLCLFSFAEWCLWNAATDMENFQRNWSTGEVEIEQAKLDGSAVTTTTIYHKTEYKERRNHYAFYSLTNAAADGFDTDRESFIGLYNDFASPQCVEAGAPSCSVAHGWSPIASHYVELSLQPGQQRDFIFLLGYVENAQDEKFDEHPAVRGLTTSLGDLERTVVNKQKAHEAIVRFSTVQAVDAAFDELRSMWQKLLSRFTLQSSDERLNRMVNTWNQYQCMITFCFSRSASFFESGIGRGMGFRDSNQDLVGFVHQIPERARQRILDIAATQFPDGSCYHQYQPLTKRGNNDIGGGFNDDPCWLIFGTVAYIKETGDFSILSEPVPFDNHPGTEVSLLEHLRVSLGHVERNLGPHGLPLIGRADWNDCLNLNCFSQDPNESFQTTENKSDGSRAESLMIAGLFVVCCREYAELCRHLANCKGGFSAAQLSDFDFCAEAAHAERAVGAMAEAVKTYGWDGGWYLRAYDYYGEKIGSRDCEEGKIFIESQGWCAMAGIGAEEGMVSRALDSCKQLLDTPYGMVLQWPAFTRYYVEMGEISSYPAGYKENAGIFCHNNPWVIIAEVLCGRADDAWQHYTKISPAWIDNQALHKVEPYVYCQMVGGRDAARPGEGKNSWLTGTAAWNWLAVTQYILGIRPTYDGLLLAPALPRQLDKLCVMRCWRDATYVITMHNNGGQRLRLVVDGQPVEGNLVPYAPGRHEVTLTIY